MPTSSLECACLREYLREEAGFQFAVALADPAVHRETLAALTADLAEEGLALLTVDLADHPGRIDLARLLRESAAGHRADAIAVVGLEAHLPPHDDPYGPAPTDLIGNINWQREVFQTNCPHPLLLWARPGDVPALATLAPDMWHWRASTFDLTTEADTPDDHPPSPALR